MNENLKLQARQQKLLFKVEPLHLKTVVGLKKKQ